MAKMIKCAGCGQQVSSKAYVCPNCGHPVRGDFLTRMVRTVMHAALGWVIILIVLWSIVLLGHHN